MELPKLGADFAKPLHADRLNGTEYSASLPGHPLRLSSADILAFHRNC
jgi:hypothetical protein